MGFTKLAERIDQLPLVLAGPIVRRVEPTTVCVWVALRLARQVKLEVFGSNRPWSAEAPTRKIGERLHVLVIELPVALVAAESYEYSMTFTRLASDAGPVGGLFDPGVVQATPALAKAALTFQGAARPSFQAMPEAIDKIRILHTSCRKIAGDGIDAFAAYVDVFDTHFAHATTTARPSALFLTGDNAYIDSADHELFNVVKDAAEFLLGASERLPDHQTLAELPELRSVVAVNDAGLMSPRPFAALGFGESAVIYLMTFSDVLWPPGYTGHPEYRAAAGRRVLANVATYMIFDDHEVSNSWYLSARWSSRVFARPLGVRVVSNALASYAVFQGWGNNPAAYQPGQPGGVLLDAIARWCDHKFSDDDAADIIRRAVGVPAASDDALEVVDGDMSDPTWHGAEVIPWHYTVPCVPIALNVLDVFTWGRFDLTRAFEPADHLPAAALDRQLAAMPATARVALYVVSSVAIHHRPRTTDPADVSNDVLEKIGLVVGIVGVTAVAYVTGSALICPAVFSIIIDIVIGVAIAVGVVALVAWTKLLDGRVPHMDWIDSVIRAAHVDEVGTEFEWHSPAFERLLGRLAALCARPRTADRLARVVFLGGDVHHSFATRLSYYAEEGANPLRAVFVQLVSSPAKYVSDEATSFDDSVFGAWGGWSQRPAGDKTSFVVDRAPWIQHLAPGAHRLTPDPEWRYRIAPVLPDPGPPPVMSPAPAAPTFESLLSGLELHAKVTLLPFRHAQLVRSNNVAEFSFTVDPHDPDQLTVRQDVYWWVKSVLDKQAGWFVRTYQTPLQPAADEMPVLP